MKVESKLFLSFWFAIDDFVIYQNNWTLHGKPKSSDDQTELILTLISLVSGECMCKRN